MRQGEGWEKRRKKREERRGSEHAELARIRFPLSMKKRKRKDTPGGKKEGGGGFLLGSPMPPWQPEEGREKFEGGKKSVLHNIYSCFPPISKKEGLNKEGRGRS